MIERRCTHVCATLLAHTAQCRCLPVCSHCLLPQILRHTPDTLGRAVERLRHNLVQLEAFGMNPDQIRRWGLEKGQGGSWEEEAWA